MSEAQTFRFEFGDDRALKEAMLMAGQALRLGAPRRGLMTVISFVSFLLMVFGGGAVAVVLKLLLTGDVGEVFWPMAIGGAVGGALAFNWYDRLVSLMSRAVLEAPFNHGPQEMRFDADGVSLINARARWHTSWAGVHGLAMGREGLAVFISGIALYVPKDVLPDDIAAFETQLTAWQQAAVA